MLSPRDETRFLCFATRKVADFRFSLHLLSRYRVFPVIPGARPREPCARVPLMLSACDETRFRCFATRKVADFRFSLHLLSRYRVFPVIPGARPRGRWKCRLLFH
ncbi:hypothetical protein NDU88_004389 [Pleurodeles waltl]|uniref:Uncharacterized protein n=1 Tax=Pleurodeles waltl TaxID=8319 RepID=A0AAV7MUF1_PLEWA|nr:hypothetical protein NDU88_004389 [Pleurodeles waltl]